MSTYQDIAKRIQPLDEGAMQAAQKRLDDLTKPQGSLGDLEPLLCRIAGMQGTAIPDITKKCVIVMAADHGIVQEGVSLYPQDVTPQMVINMAQGGAAISVLTKAAGAVCMLIDVGVAVEVAHPNVICKKIRPGTGNMLHGPAMTREEAEQALDIGVAAATQAAADGAQLLALGEMGIGNTTASSALTQALTDIDPLSTVGRGTGLDPERVRAKAAVISRVLAANHFDSQDPIDALHKVGGLEIAALAGVVLGGAAAGVPVMLDGFISTVAALVATRIAPLSQAYLLPSHCSHEPGHVWLLQTLGLTPLITANMRLGEGSGAALCFSIYDNAIRLMRDMATFSSAGVSNKE